MKQEDVGRHAVKFKSRQRCAIVTLAAQTNLEGSLRIFQRSSPSDEIRSARRSVQKRIPLSAGGLTLLAEIENLVR